MKLESFEGTNLINIQYAVMFGVIFTFCFYLNSQPNFHIIPAVASENILLFTLLLIYFLISWVTANFLRVKIEFTPFYLITWTIAIWYLGTVVVMVNSLGFSKYLLLGCYITLVSLYDFVAYRNIYYDTTKPSSIIWMILASFSLICGVYLLIPTLVVIFKLVKDIINLEKLALVIVWTFVSIRILRSIWILRRGGEM